MTTQSQTTAEILEQIIRRFAPQNRELRLTANTHLVNEAGIDSPRMIDIVLDIEDRFGLTVDDEEMQRIRTFGQLIALVEARAPQGAD
jgi:acyl carrier protein